MTLSNLTMIPLFEFSTHIQQELIRSTSDNYSVFHIIPRKAFVLHHFLMKQKIYLVTLLVFDCMLGCGSSGSIIYPIYEQLEPFGPIISIPVMAVFTYILGLIRFFYDGIWSKLFQALITIVWIIWMASMRAKHGVGIKYFFMFPPIAYDDTVCCNEERCVKCHKLFPQPLLSSTKICICVCESCPRRSDECTKCQSSPCTGMYVCIK